MQAGSGMDIMGSIDVHKRLCSALHRFQSTMGGGTNQETGVRDTVSPIGMTRASERIDEPFETKIPTGPSIHIPEGKSKSTQHEHT